MPLFKKKPSKPAEARKDQGRAAIDRGLQAIYLDAKGKVPNLETFERTRSWRVAWVFGMIGLACLCLVGLAWGGFWVFGGQGKDQVSALALALQGPADVSLGEEQSYELVWRNTELQPLKNVDVRLNTPNDFTVTSLDPAPTDARLRSWHMSLVQPGSVGRIHVKGFFVGSLGQQTALQALGTYQTNRLETVSEQTVLQTIHYSGTVLAGNILFPTRVLAGEPTQIRYAVANLGKQPLEHLYVRMTFPAGFIPGTLATTTQVDLANRTILFPIGTLSAGSFYTATVPGLFVSGASGDANFQAETGPLGVDGGLLVAARSEARLIIAPGDLTVHLVVNGGETSRSIEPGDAIRASFAYENVSNQSVHDLQFVLQVESIVNGHSSTGTSLIDWGQLDDPEQGVSSTKLRVQTLTYDKTKVPAFSELASGAQGTIDVGLATLGVTSGTKDALVRLTALTRVMVAGEAAPRVIRSEPITLTYKTDADIAVIPRYFTEEGAPLGSGPLPPQAGKTTTYRIYWQLHKKLHDLNDVKISVPLPNIVAWTGKSDAPVGAMTYDDKTRTVTWNIGRVTDATHDLEGWFEVALTPQTIDIGRFASLLGETSLQMQDARLNELITRLKPAFTTDLSEDEGAKGKGVVRKN